MFEITTNVN